MAGHSKWANRKHRKERQDAKKGKIFSKMAKRIAVAAREGGGDPETNAVLRMCVEEARSLGVPNDNIERAIKRGTGEMDGAQLEEIMYEGYGPGGVALLVQVLTDNRNRAASEVRHLFSRNGGSLGESGCVAWMFRRKGYLAVNRVSSPLEEDELFALAVEAGAEDFQVEEDTYEIFTEPGDFYSVKKELEDNGVTAEIAEITMVPLEQKSLEGKQAQQLMKLVEALEDHDDVQEVYGNFEIPDEIMVQFSD